MTRTWAASEIQARVRTSVDGTTRDLVGVGEVAIDKGFADIEWTDGAGSYRELVNDRAIFTQFEPPDGLWQRTESDGRTPTSAFADPLLSLAALSSVTSNGDEEMDGFTARRYRGILPVETARLEGLGLTDAETARVVTAANPSDHIDVEVWVDPNHRIVRIERSLSVAGVADIAADVALSNFGVMVDLLSPPSSSVIALP